MTIRLTRATPLAQRAPLATWTTRVTRATLLLACSLALPAAAADERTDYARGWPLIDAPASGAGQGARSVVVSDAVYQAVSRRDLQDLAVVDAAGEPVAADVVPAARPNASPTRQRALPIFDLPASLARGGSDITVASERNADGSVRGISARVSAVAVDATTATARQGWLVDASQVDEPILALVLDWPAQDQPLDASYRLEASDNLRDWTVLAGDASVLDVRGATGNLRQRRIPVQAKARYLRLLPLRGTGPALAAVHAELAGPPVAETWSWRALSGQPTVQDERKGFAFALDGRFPIDRVQVDTAGNSAVEWTLYSRDDASARWQPRTGPWVAYRVDEGGEAQGGEAQANAAGESAPRVLSGTVRDREWLLVPSSTVATAPTLRLGYQPESVVYLVQGTPPLMLVAGSGHATRAASPVTDVVRQLRATHPAEWTVPAATLGPSAILAGDAALAPPPALRNWTSWLLWAVLLVGALLVIGLGVSLLRGERTPPPG